MLAIRPLQPDDYAALYEFWYDLEVLRSQLYRLPPPSGDQNRWVAEQQAQDYHTALFCVDTQCIGGLVAIRDATCMIVQGLWIDIHTPQQKAAGAALWQHAEAVWRAQTITTVATSAAHRLPVEQAFWAAHRAQYHQQEFKIIL